VEASSTPVDWLGGPACLFVIHDLTDRRRAEESLVHLSNELRQALDVAHRASSAKDRFLSFVSHELRTPLTSMLLAVAALEAQGRLSPEKRDKAIQVIRRNVEIEARLVEQFLDMSSIANGDFVLAPSPVEVMDLVRRALGSCGQAACARDVAVTANMATPFFVAFADGERLQQAVVTILNTAIDVVSDGGTVHLWTEVRPGKVFEMVVRAEPMRPSVGDVARLFDPFEPVEGSQAVVRLGLAVAKRVVDGSGGSVEASAAEAGEQRSATFVVRLPAAAGLG
jgi:signal transduction histidine kinase